MTDSNYIFKLKKQCQKNTAAGDNLINPSFGLNISTNHIRLYEFAS